MGIRADGGLKFEIRVVFRLLVGEQVGGEYERVDHAKNCIDCAVGGDVKESELGFVWTAEALGCGVCIDGVGNAAVAPLLYW